MVRRTRRRLHRRGRVPVETLRDGQVGRELIALWEEAADELDWRSEEPPQLRNTDGEPLLLTTDRFLIVPGAEEEVERRLAELAGVERHESEEGSAEFVITRTGNRMHASWENTILGRAWIARGVLHVESNSHERADRLRQQVEATCGERIRHRGRRLVDPLSEKARGARSGPEPPEPLAELEPLLLDFKRRHYADWADQPLPALAGRTPREAIRTTPGRRAVDLLLREMENHEQRFGGKASFDFSGLRRSLGLGE